MNNGNGNRQWTIWVGGLLATTVLAILSTTINSVVANDKDSRARDVLESCQRELLKNETTRIDTNQKEVIKKVDKILDNQESIVKLLTRLETKIEKL